VIFEEVPDHVLIESVSHSRYYFWVDFMAFDEIGSLRCIFVVCHLFQQHLHIDLRVAYQLNQNNSVVVLLFVDEELNSQLISIIEHSRTLREGASR